MDFEDAKKFRESLKYKGLSIKGVFFHTEILFYGNVWIVPQKPEDKEKFLEKYKRVSHDVFSLDRFMARNFSSNDEYEVAIIWNDTNKGIVLIDMGDIEVYDISKN